MKKNTIWVIVILIAIIAVWLAFYWKTQSTRQATVEMATNTNFGSILVGPTGLTLYVKQGDMGQSSCYGQCAVLWPPLQAAYPRLGSGLSGTLGVITRDDGLKQVTYNNMPLYYWSNDKVPGETTGNGVNGIWTIAKP